MFQKGRLESELEEELRTHIELQTQQYLRAGMGVTQARRRARVDFGALENSKEECRDARGIGRFADFAQDLQYAFRMFRGAPGFTALVVMMLALGIGANVATFSVMDAILLRMLPVREPGSLFRTVRANGNAYDSGYGVSYKVMQQMRERTASLADLMAYGDANEQAVSIRSLEGERHATDGIGELLPSAWRAGRVGRMISPADDREPGQHAVAVIGYRL